MKKVVLAGIGQDHSGIVAKLTSVLVEQRCNIEDASMTQLEDHFTVLAILNTPQETPLNTLTTALESVSDGLQFQFSLYEIDTQSESSPKQGNPWMISVSCQDHVGIMNQVTTFLAKKDINITHLSSKRLAQGTEKNETPLFLMALEVDVPNALSNEALQEELSTIARQDNLDIRAEPLEVYTL